MDRPADVGIVGCGTAGPAAALMLARAGHAVTLYERVPDPGPVGAGIMLQPTGQAVLAGLGLLAPVAARAAKVDRLRCQTDRGRVLFDLAYGDLDPALFGMGLHRGVLFETLFAAVVAETRITLRLGVGARDLARAAGGALWLVDREGRRHGPHDAIVVADGARSQLRDDTDRQVPKRVRPYPWGALWAVLPCHSEAMQTELYQVVKGTRRMVGLLPTGHGPGPEGATGARMMSLFWSLRTDTYDAWREAGLEAWKQEAIALAPIAEGMIESIEDPDDLVLATYHDVWMPRWHTHQVVYLGDAAHAMSPQLGQGCNLALWDAQVLAECFAAQPTVPAALAAYSSARQGHLAYYQLANRGLTPFFQSDHDRTLGFLRDFGMAIAARVGWIRREMIRSMVGVKSGLLYGSEALPPRGG